MSPPQAVMNLAGQLIIVGRRSSEVVHDGYGPVVRARLRSGTKAGAGMDRRSRLRGQGSRGIGRPIATLCIHYAFLMESLGKTTTMGQP